MESAISAPRMASRLELNQLPGFARFLKGQHLRAYVAIQLHHTRAYNLPLLRFFEGYGDEDLIEIGLVGAGELLDAFIENKVDEFINKQRDQWLANSLPYMIDKAEVSADDIILLSQIKKQSLSHFIPMFTGVPEIIQALHAEMDQFFSLHNLTLSKALTTVLREKFQEEAVVKENEARLRLAIQAANIGTWDYDLQAGKIIVSDRLREIYGFGADEEISYGKFEECFLPEERKSFREGMAKLLESDEIPSTYSSEYRITRASDGEVRWLKADGKVLRDENGVSHRMIGTVIDVTDRKIMETLLKEREFQFRQLADSMPQMAWTALPDGTITFFNEKWIDYTGRDTSGITYKWGSIVHPDDAEHSKIAWENSLASGKSYEVEYRLRNGSTGEYRWFLTRALPVRNSNGDVLKWFGTCTDIHDQKLAEESLEMQARVLESMEEGVSISDESGYIIFTNAAEDRMFGYESKELIGKHVSEQNAYPPEENDRIVNDVMQQLEQKGSWSGEWHNMRKDGSTFYTFSHISTLNLEDKKLLVCVQRDITMEKINQAALLESEQRFRSLSDHAPMFVWMSDENGNLVYYNKEVQKYVGGFEDEFLKQGWTSITHQDDVEKLMTIYEKSQTDPAPFEIECRLKNASGEFRWILFRGVPRFQQGKFAGFTGTGLDIDDQKRIKDELETKVEERTKELSESNAKLERSNQELEQFAYVASHDLQEPLRKIKAFGDILENRFAEALGKDGSDMIGRMQSAADRMRILIEDLLSFSRVSRDPQPKQIALENLVKEVLLDLDAVIQDKKAKITVSSLPVVVGDELQFRQLFQNLISNALKFSREGITPEISIACRTVQGADSGLEVSGSDKARQFHLLEFTDNGIGFEQQYAEKIFQVFQRLHGRMEYPGSGVGLSIVQKVVENHKGYVTAQGTPGEGAKFSILIPVESSQIG